MSIKKNICLVLIVIAIFINVGWTSPALANHQIAIVYQNNQDINQAAMLVTPDPDSQVRIYPQPNTLKKQVGYGLSGDEVTIIQQVGSNDGQTWYLVRFNNPSQTEGWVSENYIKSSGQESSTKTLQAVQKPEPYLGSQLIKLQESPQTIQHKQEDQYRQRNTKQYIQTLQNHGGSTYNQRDQMYSR